MCVLSETAPKIGLLCSKATLEIVSQLSPKTIKSREAHGGPKSSREVQLGPRRPSEKAQGGTGRTCDWAPAAGRSGPILPGFEAQGSNLRKILGVQGLWFEVFRVWVFLKDFKGLGFQGLYALGAMFLGFTFWGSCGLGF